MKRRVDIVAKVTHAFAALSDGSIVPLRKDRPRYQFSLRNMRDEAITAEAIVLRNGFGHWGLQIIGPVLCQPNNSLLFCGVKFGVREP